MCSICIPILCKHLIISIQTESTEDNFRQKYQFNQERYLKASFRSGVGSYPVYMYCLCMSVCACGYFYVFIAVISIDFGIH